MKTIIRFEFPNGIGIFRGGNQYVTPESVQDRHTNFPTIWEEKTLEVLTKIIIFVPTKPLNKSKIG